ncbi:MAG: L-histidine N(alpha)-methyltransferase [Planctomycetota bacterium]
MTLSHTAARLAEAAHPMGAEVLAGLARREKRLSCKFFYDRVGSELFERICELPEYYPTRTELGIMDAAIGEMRLALGPRARLVEFGSGSSTKTRLLLERLDRPSVYVPIEISETMLAAAVADLRRRFPTLPIAPVCCDYMAPFQLPPAPPATERTVAYFPGSTIGNFAPDEATLFLQRIARVCGPRGGLLIGVDLRKDTSVLLSAYDDQSGVTAEFNKNALRHVNREVGADFDLDAFEHRAIWNGRDGRIEMQLVSRRAQTATVAGVPVRFRSGEVVTTEYSHKYTLDGFAALARRGGFEVERVWTDAGRWFSVQLLRTV